LGGERSGGKTGRGSGNKMPFVAAVQATPDGQPQFVRLRQQPFTHQQVAVLVARSIAPSATVNSDGLWCFGAVQIVGAEHERVVTGGGKASTKLPQFKAIDTFLGNLKRSLSGTYHAFDFAKYAHRYLAEAQHQFNRRFNLRFIFARLLRAACHSTPAPVHLTWQTGGVRTGWSWYVRAANPQARREALTSRPLLLAAVGRAASSGNQTTANLTPMHAEAGLMKSMIAKVHAAIRHVKAAAEQLPVLDRWRALLAYICQRIVGPIGLPTRPPTLLAPGQLRFFG
jgi:hypothetical protein